MSLFSPSQPSASLRARTLVLAVPRHYLAFICLLQHRQPLTPAPASVKSNFTCLPGNRRAGGRTDSRCPQGTAVSGGGAGARRGAAGARLGGSAARRERGSTHPGPSVLSAVLNRLPLALLPDPRPILRAPGSVRSSPHGSHEGPATSLAACPRQPAHPPVHLKQGNCPVIQRTLETAGNKTPPGPLPHA